MKRNEWKILVLRNRVELIIESLICVVRLISIVLCLVILFPVFATISSISMFKDYCLENGGLLEIIAKIIFVFPLVFCAVILLYPILMCYTYDLILSPLVRRTEEICIKIKSPPPPVEIMVVTIEYPHIYNRFLDITIRFHKESPPFRKVYKKWSSGYSIVGKLDNYEWTVKFPLKVWVNMGIKILSRNENAIEDGCKESERINFFINLFHEAIKQGNFCLEDIKALLLHLKISEGEMEAIFDALAPQIWEILLTKDVRQVM